MPWFYNAFHNNKKKIKGEKRSETIILIIFTYTIYKEYYIKTNYTIMVEDPKF